MIKNTLDEILYLDPFLSRESEMSNIISGCIVLLRSS